jgi:hypothetical protein
MTVFGKKILFILPPLADVWVFFFNLRPDESWDGQAPQMTLQVAPLPAAELLSIDGATSSSSSPSLKPTPVLYRAPLCR